jgi:hypothetical protein
MTLTKLQDTQFFQQWSMTAAQEAVTLARFQTWSYAAIQLTGTFVGTVTFETTVDGTNWVTVSVTPSNSVTTVTSATAPGVWFVQITGFAGVRARVSAYTSGTITASIKALPSQT